jgi:large subunit ribosomal protein L15
MTVNKRKKVSRYRGSMTHGGGSKKKRRGAGNRGGRGMAGTGKRGDSRKPSIWGQRYFGKRGFVSKKRKRIQSLNINYLDNHIDELISRKIAVENNSVIEIDLSKAGYNKLLSKGSVKNKYKINTKYASAQAIKKIKEKGGEVILSKQPNI